MLQTAAAGFANCDRAAGARYREASRDRSAGRGDGPASGVHSATAGRAGKWSSLCDGGRRNRAIVRIGGVAAIRKTGSAGQDCGSERLRDRTISGYHERVEWVILLISSVTYLYVTHTCSHTRDTHMQRHGA